MGVLAFVYWQALDSAGWGLIQSNPGDNRIGTPNPKYYFLAQYSRHIRLGMVILATDVAKTVLAMTQRRNLNMGNAQTVTYDFEACTKVTGPIKAGRPKQAAREHYIRQASLSPHWPTSVNADHSMAKTFKRAPN
ncbi:hypothetical protein PsorP6_007200 [Peronosclerospora sorghi]|uniref:Uncharacterized protein n=1 Tax=Peronosclerospora sorghi TaxID=230839 RepID=A0ACC0WAN3_9STRA|nr:hypothetical protein PsorP6_007200 [Peronosclerospora sorghi]